MAVDAVALNGGNTKNVYFPFAEDANGLEEQIKKKNFDRASAAALKELRALKPYKGGNVALRGLHDLDVTDKHKLIIPAAYEKSAALYYGKEPRPEFPEDFCPKCDTNVDYRDKSATICWRGSLTFDSTSPFAGDEVVPTLHRLTDKVAAIINNFRAVLSP